MIKIYTNFNTEDILNRTIADYGPYEEAVRAIVSDVAARGDAALKEYAAKFDGAQLDSLEVTEEEFAEAENSLSED